MHRGWTVDEDYFMNYVERTEPDVKRRWKGIIGLDPDASSGCERAYKF